MWNLVIWIDERIPQVIKEAETRYCVVAVSKFAETEMMSGGVMIPACS
jgi:hypothetical protein